MTASRSPVPDQSGLLQPSRQARLRIGLAYDAAFGHRLLATCDPFAHFAHGAMFLNHAHSPNVSSEALPPAAVVLMVTVFSVVKRGR